MRGKVYIFISFIVFLSLGLTSCKTKDVISEAVDISEIIEIGGINQYISIKGKDDTKPIILFLHGGPGNAQSSFAHKYQSKLEIS